MPTATSSGAPAPRPRPSASPAPQPLSLPRGGLPRPPQRLQYTGVVTKQQQAAGPPTTTPNIGGGGGWMARVLVDPDRGTCRTIGPFPDPHAAALAHDRVAFAYLGDRARTNFPGAFHAIELRFLRLCRARGAGEIDVCALAADPPTYEARYATFLRSVFRLKRWGGEFNALLVDFFVRRAAEIGDDVLADAEGRERLEDRFVEMHRNRAVDPEWRASYIRRALMESQQRRQKQKQKQVAAVAAVQP